MNGICDSNRASRLPISYLSFCSSPLVQEIVFLLEAIPVAWVPRLQETIHCHKYLVRKMEDE